MSSPAPSYRMTELATLFVYAVVHELKPREEAVIDMEDLDELSEILNEQMATSFDAATIIQMADATRHALQKADAETMSAASYDNTRAKLIARLPRAGSSGVKLWPPTSQTVRAHLGGGAWNDALKSLGIPASHMGRARGAIRFTRDDFKQALTDFHATDGTNGSYSSYQSWVKLEREQGRERPAGATVRNTFGSWLAAKQEFSLD